MTLPLAIIFVIHALCFYSVAVIKELKSEKSTKRQLFLFSMGLGFDVAATVLMFRVSEGFSLNWHSVLGLTALVLMAIKLFWSFVFYKIKEGKKVPKCFTLFVWFVWIFVFVSGLFVR